MLSPVGRRYDFMKMRGPMIGLSLLLTVGSLLLLFFGNLNLGTDFKGGTEVEVAFKSDTSAKEIREAVDKAGFSTPDVIKVDDVKDAHRYIIRVHEVSTIDEAKRAELAKALCVGESGGDCPPERQASEMKISPGGDKISLRFRDAPDLDWVRERLGKVSGLALRQGANSVTLQNASDNKVEVELKSKGDQLLDGLREALGPAKVPESALRVEWIGPKAGAQLRDSALASIAISLVFVMAYIAFRFDVRYAPGAVLALIHDAVAAVGILILMGREINLTTVAAVLTIIGYSVNDTVVVYDRVRENVGRMRGASFTEIINASLSEMLSRTILSNGTVILSLLAFFVWGTGTLKDFALTLVLGVSLGTYSSIYVALPLTEWLDRKFFSRFGSKKPRAPIRKKAEAVV